MTGQAHKRGPVVGFFRAGMSRDDRTAESPTERAGHGPCTLTPDLPLISWSTMERANRNALPRTEGTGQSNREPRAKASADNAREVGSEPLDPRDLWEETQGFPMQEIHRSLKGTTGSTRGAMVHWYVVSFVWCGEKRNR